MSRAEAEVAGTGTYLFLDALAYLQLQRCKIS